MQSQHEKRRFERPEILRPPSESRSYFLPLTSGCSNNTCSFCRFHGRKLGIRALDDIKREIDALSLYINNGLRLPDADNIVYDIARHWDGRMIFLQDGDALVYPFKDLVEVLTYVNEKFPGLERIATYATPKDILRRSPDELRTLRQLKLGIYYMGIESGDDRVLQRINKGATHAQMVEAGLKVREAGITLSVTVILGLGGVEGSRQHALETARILTEIDPDYVGALTLSLVPDTPLYREYMQNAFSLIILFDSLAELEMIIENSSFTDCFFSSMHASNYLAVRGRLPGDKERMLAQLSRVLREGDPSLLRPEFLRGL